MNLSPSRRLAALGALFAVTGCAGLLSEQCFERLLGTLLGASTPAAATVLAAYFAGLTLGGLGYARRLRPRVGNALRAYGLLEAAIGGWTLLLFVAFDRLIPALGALLALARDRPFLLLLLRLLVAALWILPLTVPMGATFPAIVDALEQLGPAGRRGQAMARFYALNLAGAIAGSVLGPFVAFPLLGLDGTLLGGGLLDLVAALLSLRLAEGLIRLAPPEAEGPAAARPPLPLLLVAAGSGFVLFSLEVLWTHLIAAVLGNSVYAFASMLAMVLLGLGLAGWLASVLWGSRGALPASVTGNALLLGALSLGAGKALWPQVPHALAVLGRDITGFAGAEGLRWGAAAVLLLPPATLLGLVYPSLFRLALFPDAARGRAAGWLVAVNSLGCIGGALFCGFGLVPLLGSERTLLLLAWLCGAMGLLLNARSFRTGRQRPALMLLFLLLSSVFLPRWDRLRLTSGEHVYFKTEHVLPASRLRFFHEDTHGGITTVVENPPTRPGGSPGPRVLLTNGKFQGNDSGEMDAQVGFALVPALYTAGQDDALVIGLGTGQSAHVLDALGFGRIDIAEIAPGIVRAAAGHFDPINGGILRRPAVRLYLEDGRNLLLLRERRYDLISMELTSIWFAGATNLYSREFYRLASRRLKPGGVLQQWIQLHHIGTVEVLSVILTLRSVFAHVSFWVVGGQGILVASQGPQVLRRATLERVGPRGAHLSGRADLAAVLRALLSQRLLAPSDVGRMADQLLDVPLNTDRNRYLEYYTPRYNYDRVPWKPLNITHLARFASFPAPELEPGLAGPLADACRGIGVKDYLDALGLHRGRQAP